MSSSLTGVYGEGCPSDQVVVGFASIVVKVRGHGEVQIVGGYGRLYRWKSEREGRGVERSVCVSIRTTFDSCCDEIQTLSQSDAPNNSSQYLCRVCRGYRGRSLEGRLALLQVRVRCV